MFLGFVVFAAKVESEYTLTYGFAFAVINFIVFIAAAIAGILQMHKKGILPIFHNQITSLRWAYDSHLPNMSMHV